MAKSELLWNARYVYDFDRDLYVNRAARKAFSLEFVDDHGEDELVRRIQENNTNGEWEFYFNQPPSESVRRELETVL